MVEIFFALLLKVTGQVDTIARALSKCSRIKIKPLVHFAQLAQSLIDLLVRMRALLYPDHLQEHFLGTLALPIIVLTSTAPRAGSDLLLAQIALNKTSLAIVEG